MTDPLIQESDWIECEHGYRAAGGSFDCPACEAEKLEASRTAWERNNGPVYERSFGVWVDD